MRENKEARERKYLPSGRQFHDRFRENTVQHHYHPVEVVKLHEILFKEVLLIFVDEDGTQNEEEMGRKTQLERRGGWAGKRERNTEAIRINLSITSARMRASFCFTICVETPKVIFVHHSK